MISMPSILRKDTSEVSKKTYGPIGIEFSLRRIHLVQMEKIENNETSIRASSAIDFGCSREEIISSPRKLKALLKKTLRQEKFIGSEVVASVPSDRVKVFFFSYQLSKDANEDEIIINRLRDRMKEDLSEYVIDYIHVRASDSDSAGITMVAVTKRDYVISYLELLRKSGLHVKALDISPAAITRLISSTEKVHENKNILIINFGREVSYLTLLYKKKVLFDQDVKFGEDMLIEKISNILDLPTAIAIDLINRKGMHSLDYELQGDEGDVQDISIAFMDILKPLFLSLINEINRALIYVAAETHGESINKIFLLGGIARWSGVDILMNKLLGMPVDVLNPSTIFNMDGPSLEASDNVEMVVATGLALRGMTEDE